MTSATSLPKEPSKKAQDSGLRRIAHVTETEPRQCQMLDEHLSNVSMLAAQFAAPFSSAQWAALAGRWHDLGKGSEDFQKYIRQASGFEADLAGAAPRRVDHSTAGAVLAEKHMGKAGRLLAYAIAGHHAGLPDGSAANGAGASSLENRMQHAQEDHLLDRALAFVPMPQEERTPAALPSSVGGVPGLHLWMRMLFSCLVDADYLDTEVFLDPQRAARRGAEYRVADLLAPFHAFMEEKQRSASASEVNRIRAELLAQCRSKAECAPGIFTLTVPTGGGKTLSSLAFALEHARIHEKRRIIYAIPYTSIIEQTADVFRAIYKNMPGAVLEHHSNLRVESNEDRQQETAVTTERNRLAAENWDAPLIVTTNVQLFESLFAARTSRCRKLHNIANSVLILDEAQLLPPDFLQPVVDVLRLLTEHYGVTVVLCTATQPALCTQLGGPGKIILRGLDQCTEIVASTEVLYRRLERTRVHVPEDLNRRESWDDLAARIQQHSSVLAIVNTRADCAALHARMPEGTIHLSARMCGEHRSVVIEEIKKKLGQHEPVRVVSTQLIEAGVDVDFPVVYRALAGLDSIAQAAGRCNREGHLAEKGEVFVFTPPRTAPQGLLRFGEQASTLLLEDDRENSLSPENFARYFRHYYAMAARSGGLDKKGILDLLANASDLRQNVLQFRTAADAFRMIEESASILVPYANPSDANRDARILLARLRAGEMHRDILRQLQRFSVSVRPYEFCRLQKNGEIEEIVPGIWSLRNETAYSKELGLLLGETGAPDAEKLYC